VKIGALIASLALGVGLAAPPAAAGTDRWTTDGPQGGATVSIVIDPSDPSTLYAGAFGGIFKSTDGGRTWDVLNDHLPHALLAMDPLHPRTIYAASGGVWMSTDGGATWRAADTGLPSFTSDFTPAYVTALAIDPRRPDTLYLGAKSSGFSSDCYFGLDVYRSTDGGAHWAKSSTGMDGATEDGDGQEISSFAVDPTHSARVYAASAGTSCDTGAGSSRPRIAASPGAARTPGSAGGP